MSALINLSALAGVLGRQGIGFPQKAVPKGLTSLGLDARGGSATERLPTLCLFCPSHDILMWGSGNAQSGTHASKTPHFLECLGCAEEVYGNF